MLITLTPDDPPEPSSERMLHLIDAENLLGGPNFDRARACRGRAAYEAIAPTGTVNQVVLATSHHAAPSAWFAWPSPVRRLLGSGPDGADLALLGVMAAERLEHRFERVVIGSGDGIFAFPAARLQAAGCSVTVVTRRHALSRRL